MIDFETFKKTIKLIQENNLRYWVFGGFALDGVRGKISRDHEDIDIYLHKKDIDRFVKLFALHGYDCYQRERMYFADSPELKIGVVLFTEEKDFYVSNGNCTLAKYPREMFLNNLTASIENFNFRKVPNEVLAFEYEFSIHEEDKKYAKELKTDKKLMSQIKTVKIRDSRKNNII